MDEDTRTLTEDDKIYDLVDVVEDGFKEALSADTLDDQGYNDTGEEAREEVLPSGILSDEIAGLVERIAEKIAREMFPSIAERIIREEIDRMKENPGG